jgi:hypothetical protein
VVRHRPPQPIAVHASRKCVYARRALSLLLANVLSSSQLGRSGFDRFQRVG